MVMLEEKKGSITDVIYHNDDNGYTIAVVETDDEQFTAVGYLPNAKPGRVFLFTGKWKVHPTYGEQFAFSEFKEEMPDTDEGIKAFLASGAIKGIGPKMAATIVRQFGDDTFRIIEEDPNTLMTIEGIGEKKVASISESFRAHREFAEVTLYFNQYGISTSAAMKMYREYGSDTIKMIDENPYRMVNDIYGIGFRTADKIAMKMGIEENSEYRIRSGILYTLWAFASEGSTYVPKAELIDKTIRLLDVTGDEIEDNLLSLVFDGEVQEEDIDGSRAVFIESFYWAEKSICSELMRLKNSDVKELMADIDSLISVSENDMGISLSQRQKYAVRQSLNSGVFVITGGPGTGKTTIINAIIDIFDHCKFKTAIAAPTGRAAKKMTETTGNEASTIHRLLEYYHSELEDEMKFGRNRENPLEYDVIIVDEASMIDVFLMRGLLDAIPTNARLIIVGDADQLPPVGPGNVLRDMLESEMISSAHLNEIFRQAKESMIVVNAHRINQGEYPYVNEKDKDFFLVKRKGERQILEGIIDLCERRLPDYYKDCDPIKDMQILTPVKKGILGNINMNVALQAVLNPPDIDKNEKKFGDRIFREGDKVMQIRNNYSLRWKDKESFNEGEGIFNGDVGYIQTIDSDYNIITVVYDNTKYVEYEFSNLDEIEHAYAITVHKSQGSEFPMVIMPISAFPPALATRNLIYTAVTRGKKADILIGSQERLNAMVENDLIKERYSALGVWLNKYISQEGLSEQRELVFQEEFGDQEIDNQDELSTQGDDSQCPF